MTFLFILIIIYLLLIAFIELGIRKNRVGQFNKFSNDGQTSGNIFLSVLIPFHNEVDSLGLIFSDIKSQTLDTKKFEVIWINDRSSDGGVEIVRDGIHGAENHSLIETKTDEIISSGKRNALKKGISIARGDFIVFTDADCRFEQNWLEHIWENISKTGAGVIGGPVIKRSKGLLNIFFKWEQFLTNKIAECFYGFQNPIMTFGSNWGMKLDLFIKNDGYRGADETLSGDDDLLLQKISNSNTKKIWLYKNPVKTRGPDSIGTLWRQKRRHLSAGKKYNFSGILFFGILHLTNVLFVFYPFFIKTAIWGLTIKVLIDVFWLSEDSNAWHLIKSIPEILLFELYFTLMSWIIGTISFLFPAKRW